MTKNSTQIMKFCILAICFFVIGMGIWGTNASFVASKVSRGISSVNYTYFENFAQKMHYTSGIFITTVIVALYVMYSLMIDNKKNISK